MTKTEKNVNAMLQFIYNNFKKEPFDSKRIAKWCVEFNVSSALFYNIVAIGAVSKVGRGLYVLNDYNSKTYLKVLEYMAKSNKISADKKKVDVKIPPPISNGHEKHLVPLQSKIDESVEFLKAQGYRIMKPVAQFEEI